MKKKYILLAGLLAVTLIGGCGKKDSDAGEVTPTPTPTIETSGQGDVVTMEKSTGIDKSKITKIMGTKTATASDLVITNNTGLEISNFFTRPSNTEDWDDDYIDGTFTLKEKEQALFYYEPDAKDDDGNTITKYDLRVSYTDEDESDCLFRNLNLSDIEELELNMEDGVPFVKYTSLATKKQISTLEEAKVRMGRTDSDTEDENSDSEETTITPTPTETPASTETPTATPTPDEGTTTNPGDMPGEGNTLEQDAEQYIGGNTDSLFNGIGSPSSSEYEEDPESGAQIGYHYYDGFTVSTIQQDGQETVTGVW